MCVCVFGIQIAQKLRAHEYGESNLCHQIKPSLKVNAHKYFNDMKHVRLYSTLLNILTVR